MASIFKSYLFWISLSLVPVISIAQIDQDNDGMPQSWELANGLDDNDPTDAFGDPDCDQVINLFEFQLQTGINDDSSPRIYEVTPQTTQTEFKNIIDRGFSEAICVRLQEGIYDFFYDLTGWNSSAYNIMIQGGWDSSFTQYSPFRQESRWNTSSLQNGMIYISSLSASRHGTCILDGISVDGGNNDRSFINLVHRGGNAYFSYYNCSFYEFGGKIDLDFYNSQTVGNIEILNCSFYDTNGRTLPLGRIEGIIDMFASFGATCDFRVLNSSITLQNVDNVWNGIAVNASENSIISGDIYNSIIWSDNASLSNAVGSYISSGGTIAVNLYNSNLSAFTLATTGTNIVNEPDLDLTDTNPFFELRGNKLGLAADSPLKEIGTDLGVAKTGTNPDLGMNDVISSYDFDFDLDLVQPECNASNGSIALNYTGQLDPGFELQYFLDGVPYQMQSSFSNLSEGQYHIAVSNNVDCRFFEYSVELSCQACDASLEDSDNDGMPNVWEENNNLDPCDPSDAFGDRDCDQVWNLYEYQLGSDLDDKDSPPTIFIDATMSFSDIQGLISQTSDTEPLLIKFEEGIYEGFSLDLELFTGLTDKVMIQGGWNKCLMTYDPIQNRTVLKNHDYVYIERKTTCIYDGLEFDNSRLAFHYFIPESVHSSISNCGFYNTQSVNATTPFFVRSNDNAVDFHMTNCSFVNSDRGIYFGLYGTSTDYIKAQLINVTITDKSQDVGITCSERLGSTGGVIDLTLKDCNIWDDDMNASVLLGEGQFDAGEYNLYVSRSNLSPIEENPSSTVKTILAPDVIEVDPLFDNRVAPYYELNAGSPLVGLWNDKGLYPESVSVVGLGHNLDFKSCFPALPLAMGSSLGHSDCSFSGEPNGSITLYVFDGIPPYTYNWETDTDLVLSNTDSYSSLSAGNYSVTVTDAVGCTLEESFDVIELNPQDCGPECDDTLEDSDNDGMPNAWEENNGLDPCDPSDAFGDIDCDQVWNLYEYQLGSDLNDENSPQSLYVTVDMALSEIQNDLLGIDINSPLVIKFIEGNYDGQAYAFDDFNNLPSKVMFQGGWACDRTYDPITQRTIITYAASSIFNPFKTIIYDGFEFNGVSLSNRLNSGYASVSNCAFYRHALLFSSISLRGQGDNNEFSVFNCSFTEVQNDAVIISSDYAYSYCKVRMINTTITSIGVNSGGLECGESLFFSPDVYNTRDEWDALDGTTDIFIKDCNLWDSDPNANMINLRIPFATGGTFNLNLENSNISKIQKAGIPGMAEGEAELLNVDPLFMNMDPPYFELSSASPLEGLSDGYGLYEENFSAAIGHNQSSVSCAGDPLAFLPELITNSDCSISGLPNGAIDVSATGGTASYSYNWSTNNGEGLATNDEDQTGLSGGDYQVTVTDALGCTETATYVVNELNPQDCIPDCDETLADSDNDGIPNLWEEINSLDPCDPTDALCDPDGDQVINLFEYQLQSDPYNDMSPTKVDVPASSTQAVFLSNIDLGFNGPVVLRMEEGTYDYLSEVQNANADFRLMIQGGWSPGFTEYDPFRYETLFNGTATGPILEYSGGVTPTNCTYILDGINFNRSGNIDGAVYFTHRAGESNFSFYNCIFYDNIGDVDIDILGPAINQTEFINCAFTNQENLFAGSGTGGGIIKGFIDQGAQADWRVLNTTMNRVGDQWWNGIGFLVRTNSYLNLDIINSNIWSGDSDRPHSVRFVESSGDIDYEVINSNLSSIFNARTGVTDNQLLNIDPLFNPLDLKCRSVSDQSPLHEAADNYGVAYIGAADIGINKVVKVNRANYEVVVSKPLCGLNNGAIEVNFTGYIDPTIFVQNYIEYSIDGDTFQSTPFTDLSAGTYEVWATSYLDDCVTYLGLFTLEELDVNEAITVNEVPANCGEANGMIELVVPQDWVGYQYAIGDTTNFQTATSFDSLSANLYLIWVKTPDGCNKLMDAITLNSLREVELDTIKVDGTSCGLNNGILELEVNQALGTPMISINGNPASDTLNYTNLVAGLYSIVVTDEEGCKDSLEVSIASSTGIAITDTMVTQPTCGLDNGAVLLNVNDPGSVTEVTLNNQAAGLTLNSNLSPGNYQIVVTDNIGCTDQLTIELEISEPLEIITIDSIATTCNLANGSVIINQVSGSPTQYSLDGNSYLSLDPSAALLPDTISALSFGTYSLYMQNADCADTTTFSIAASTVPELQIASFDGTSCGEDNGSVELSATGGAGSYEFLIDTISNGSGVFDSLPADTYIAYVEDLDECIDDEQLSIAGSQAAGLAVTVTDGECGEPGFLELFAVSGSGDYEFGEDDQVYSTVSQFGIPESGDYTFYLRDSDGCIDSITTKVEVYGKPELEIQILKEALCEDAVGEVSLTGIAGKEPLSYAIKGEAFTSAVTYGNLSSGVTTFVVQDSTGCMTEWDVDVPSTPNVRIENLAAEQLFCGDVLSAVEFTPAGGTGTRAYIITDSDGNLVDESEGLIEGQYRLTVKDELGCEISELIVVQKEECQMYIPTIFDPLAEGEDKTFRIGVPDASEFFIKSFQIFDRWGNLIYDKENIDPLTFADWWDGTFNGRKVEQGVYVYVIEMDSDKIELIRSTITVIR